jgi:NTP pyrophosphatase (non-canonical NTP hydrolase)
MELNEKTEGHGDLTLNLFQIEALKTAVYPQNDDLGIFYTSLKLNGEAGEVAEKVGKFIRGDYDYEHLKGTVKKELGDVLWYLAACSHEFGYTLEEVADTVLFKLKDRQERGVIKGNGDER